MTPLYWFWFNYMCLSFSSFSLYFSLVLCPMLCKNGGVCIQKDRCLCPSNFTGKFCHIPASSSSSSINEIEKPANQGLMHSAYVLPLQSRQQNHTNGKLNQLPLDWWEIVGNWLCLNLQTNPNVSISYKTVIQNFHQRYTYRHTNTPYTQFLNHFSPSLVLCQFPTQSSS